MVSHSHYIDYSYLSIQTICCALTQFNFNHVCRYQSIWFASALPVFAIILHNSDEKAYSKPFTAQFSLLWTSDSRWISFEWTTWPRDPRITWRCNCLSTSDCADASLFLHPCAYDAISWDFDDILCPSKSENSWSDGSWARFANNTSFGWHLSKRLCNRKMDYFSISNIWKVSLFIDPSVSLWNTCYRIENFTWQANDGPDLSWYIEVVVAFWIYSPPCFPGGELLSFGVRYFQLNDYAFYPS